MPLALGSSLKEDQPKSPAAMSEVKGGGAGPWPAVPRPRCEEWRKDGEPRQGILYHEEGQRRAGGELLKGGTADFKGGMSRCSSGSASGPAVAAVARRGAAALGGGRQAKPAGKRAA